MSISGFLLSVRKVSFEIADYVLVAQRTLVDKLDARWKGPALISGIVNEQVYEVHNVLTGKKEHTHCSRVKLYEDQSKYTLSEKEIKDQLQYQERYQVESLLEIK